MAWFTDRQLFLFAVIVYGLSMVYSVFLWRKGFRRDDYVNYLLLLLGFCAHSAAMFLRGFRLNHCPVSNLFEATMFIAWTMVAFYLVAGLWSRLRFLGAFAAPLMFAIGVFALMPDLDKPGAKLALDTAQTNQTLAAVSPDAQALVQRRSPAGPLGSDYDEKGLPATINPGIAWGRGGTCWRGSSGSSPSGPR